MLAMPALSAKHAGPVMLQLRAALHALKREDYDVIHVHASENGFVVPLLRLRYPVVTTNHGPAYEREKWGALARRLIRANERLSLRWATIATAVAANQAEALSRRYRCDVIHIPNGVTPEPADNRAAATILDQAKVQPGRYLLFAAARIDPTKGCHTLLEALDGLKECPPLVVVGDLHHAPGYEDRLRGLASGLPVTFVSRLDDKAALLGLLGMCRAFVFPSTVEAMSMMLLEALSTGALTLASDIPENTAVLPPGFPTFRAGDVADLQHRLAALLTKDEDYRHRLRSEAIEWVRDHYEWDGIAEEYEALYESAAGR